MVFIKEICNATGRWAVATLEERIIIGNVSGATKGKQSIWAGELSGIAYTDNCG